MRLDHRRVSTFNCTRFVPGLSRTFHVVTGFFLCCVSSERVLFLTVYFATPEYEYALYFVGSRECDVLVLLPDLLL